MRHGRCTKFWLVTALTAAMLQLSCWPEAAAGASRESPGPGDMRAHTERSSESDPVPTAAPKSSVKRHARKKRSWPVAGRSQGWRPQLVQEWNPPESDWGTGHRGVDLATQEGASVRAAAPGRVSFVGPVAGRQVISIELRDTGKPPLRTTYEPVRASVEEGEQVSAGEVVGTVQPGPFHCEKACLHWGLLRADRYLDPLTLLPDDMLRSGSVRLLPYLDIPQPKAPAAGSKARKAQMRRSPVRGETGSRRPVRQRPS